MATAAKPADQTFTDVKTLRANARKNIDDGAVTRTYPADREVIV